MNTQTPREFKYNKLTSYLIGLFAVFLILYHWSLALSQTYGLIKTILNSPFNIQLFFAYFVFIVLYFAVPITVANYWQNFTILDEGIEFQVFYLWKILVPWNEILEIKQTSIILNSSHTIILERLTIFHRVMGIFYGKTLKPAFVFNKSIKDYELAVEMIQNHLDSQSE